MSRCLSMLCVLLLAGCGHKAPAPVDRPPPAPASTDFSRLTSAIAAIQPGEVILYEGLPSQFWEPQQRETELRQSQTIELHGYPFYEELLPLQKSDAEQLTALFTAPGSFQTYSANKKCSEFHVDYGLEWNSAEGKTAAFVSLECGEVEIFGPKGSLRCDFSDAAAQTIKQLLKHHSNNRPEPDDGKSS